MGTEFNRKKHWNRVYSTRQANETSWYQGIPAPSLEMIEHAACGLDAPIIDIGGGASLLVDYLVERGYTDITVLDISSAALELARNRLGGAAQGVTWLTADVTEFTPDRQYALWHDRAAFHFLTDPAERMIYSRVLHDALLPDGQAVIATFAPDGPEKCSGLEVQRYEGAAIQAELGAELVLLEELLDTHHTPLGREQRFAFYRLQRLANMKT